MKLACVKNIVCLFVLSKWDGWTVGTCHSTDSSFARKSGWQWGGWGGRHLSQHLRSALVIGARLDCTDCQFPIFSYHSGIVVYCEQQIVCARL